MHLTLDRMENTLVHDFGNMWHLIIVPEPEPEPDSSAGRLTSVRIATLRNNRVDPRLVELQPIVVKTIYAGSLPGTGTG